MQKTWKLETIISNTGKYAVDIGPGGIAKRIETSLADGNKNVQHWIELQDGETPFNAVCIDGESESTLVSTFMKMDGIVAQQSKHPGHWFEIKRAGREGRMRILAIDGRGCMASVEGPTGQVPTARIEPFLLSLRSVP